jgi:hypothetical protein
MGTAIRAITPKMATTINSSISVNPPFLLISILEVIRLIISPPFFTSMERAKLSQI